jgi:lipoprotein signal peptidase
MLPKLFGIFDSYTVMLVLGILASFVLAIIYIKYKKYSKKDILDLIICGATGLNAVERFFIGSSAEAITRHAKCDVLVVRTPEE